MTRTPEEFKQAAIENDIRFWKIHNCGFCNYPCGYFFSDDHELVGYDSGCDCTRCYVKEQRSWDDIAAAYNMQKIEVVIKKMDEFWGFK